MDKKSDLLTCPHCNESFEVRNPKDYEDIDVQCPECGEYLKPKPGSCCVFCSYGSK